MARNVLKAESLQKILSLLLAVTLCFQTSLHFWFPWSYLYGVRIDYLSVSLYAFEIVLFVFVMGFVFNNFNHQKKYLFTVDKPQALKVFAILLLAVVNILLSVNPARSIFGFFVLIEMALFVIAMTDIKNLTAKSLTWAFVITVTAVFFIGLYELINNHTLGGIASFLGERRFSLTTPGIALGQYLGSTRIRPYATFPHPNVLSAFLAIGLLMFQTLENSLSIKEKKMKWITVFIVLLMSFFLLLTRSKNALLALIITELFWIIFQKVSRESLIKKFTAFLLLGCIVFSLVLPFLSDKITFLETRKQGFRSALKAVKGSYIFGTGLGTQLYVLANTEERPSLPELQPVHNLYLSIFVETGVIGLMVLFIVVFRLVENTKDPKKLPLLWFIFLSGLFDHYWWTLKQPIFLWGLVIVLLIKENNYKKKYD